MQIHRNAIPAGVRASLAFVAALALSLTFVAATPAAAATLDRIRETGHIKLGYLTDARPFAYKTEAGGADGYSVALCTRIAEAAQKQLGGAPLSVDWVPVAFEGRLRAVQEGSIDLLCAPTSVTLARRAEVSFSIPTFPGGTRAVVRADAAPALREALSDTTASHVVWRGSPAAKTLSNTSIAVVTGTTTQSWLANRIASLNIGAKSVAVPDYKTGLQLLRDHKVDLFFGDRSLVLGAMDRTTSTDLVVLDRLFTREPLALALARNDADFRLLVDRTLSQLYSSGEFRELYTKWFGDFNDNTQSFFLWNVIPQ